jgi:hypothetical protein
MNTISSDEGVQTNRGVNTGQMGMTQEYQQVQANDLFNRMNAISSDEGVHANRGMNIGEMGMQQEFQQVQANDLFNQMNTISSDEGVHTNRGMNTGQMGMTQEYQQVQAIDLFNRMNTISSQEAREIYDIGQQMQQMKKQFELQSYELEQRLKQEKEMQMQQMIKQVELQNYELEKTLKKEKEMQIQQFRQQQQVARSPYEAQFNALNETPVIGENHTFFQNAGGTTGGTDQARDYRNQQQQIPPQQLADFLRQQQHRQQLLTLHPYLYDGQLPFSISQRGFRATNANNVRHSDGPNTKADGVARQAMEYVGQHPPILHQCQQYDTNVSMQQVQQTEVPVMHKSAGDSTTRTFSSSITESWLKGSIGSDYAFNSVGEDIGSGIFDNSMNLSAVFSERELKMFDYEDNNERPSQSEDEVSKIITPTIDSINSSSNNDNLSGRRKRSNNATKSSAMREISQWTKEVRPFEAVVQSNDKHETDDSQRNDIRSGTLSSENAQLVRQTSKNETNILLLPIQENSESDSNMEFEDSALSNNFDGNLSMDSKMLEDLLMMKKSGQSQDMRISNLSFFNSTGVGEAEALSPSNGIQKVDSLKSSSRSSKSSKSSKRSSIMSEITQWSDDNQFEASVHDRGSNEDDVKENGEKYDISCSGLSLL